MPPLADTAVPLVVPKAANPLHTADRFIWALIAATALIVAFAPLAGFAIRWDSWAAPAAAIVALMLVAALYRHWRGEELIASAVEGTAQLVAFAAVGAPLSYFAARLSLPLWDHAFDAAD